MGKRIRGWKTYYQLNHSTGCWEWLGNLHPTGYGYKYHNGNLKRVHRLFYELHIGPIPKGKLVCHRCDNKKCVNPKHLFIGTHQDNADDCRDKGRTLRGSKNKSAKLTESIVRRIRKDGRFNTDIAKTYGVAPRTIGKIKNKESWAWVK